ncbi:hypothetical protein [Sphaerisporangium sp. TRM90804]|uniref:hypothetical protein n=1 Tax=Sphaerisporangium sp. TRM90804 TaxID=3031113 RepID=UPI00244C922F|nr:hypothetical protein [Sphaerisporangium sp. TRM90804]MDH2426404.1 hypothetical protein [Sphaerisporangium sp. TRM90804]
MLSTVAILLIRSGAERDWSTGVRWTLAALGWVSGASMVLYSFMFPLRLLMILGGLFGMDVSAADWVTLTAQGAGAIGGAATIAIAVTEQRRARGACQSCGRVHGRSPDLRDGPSPSWAYLAGYLAVAACVARFIAEIVHGFVSSKAPEIPWTFMITFLVMMLLAGTLLPLALVHRWGRIWPRWVLPLAGRKVPRWLVAGPGFFVGAGLTTYFGIGGMTAWATGDNVDGATWFLAVVLPAYTLWGLGLLVAATSYFTLTRPECALSRLTVSYPRRTLHGDGYTRCRRRLPGRAPGLSESDARPAPPDARAVRGDGVGHGLHRGAAEGDGGGLARGDQRRP